MSTAVESIAGLEGPRPGGNLAAVADAVRRRAVPVAVAFGGVLAVSLLLALFWPDTYRSTATLTVDLQGGPATVADPSLPSDPYQRIEAIGRRVMTPDDLLAIVSQHEVFGTRRDEDTREALVERMRHDIRLDVIDTAGAQTHPRSVPGSRITFSVGFEHRSPELTARVAADLVALFLRSSSGPPDAAEPGAAEALARDAERLRQRIDDVEQRVAAFRQRNTDRLPESAEANLATLARATAELRETDARIDALERAQDDAADRDATARRLEEARSWLAIDRERFAPDHPNVRRLEREVASLEKRLQGVPTSGEQSRLVARRRDLQAQIETLQQAQLQMPVVAREYAALMQEIQDEQGRLDEVRRQQLAVGLAASEAATRRAERFTLVESPARPESPVRPNRIAILAVGLLAAIAAALGMLGILELRETRIRGRRGVIALLGAPPLAVIPWATPARSPAT